MIFLILLSATSCGQGNNSVAEDSKTEDYKGPIIDMHIHAFSDGNPLFGATHPPTLRGETFAGVESAASQKEETLKKFQEYNIVKAMVTDGHLWEDEATDAVLVGQANLSPEDIRDKFEEGTIDIIAEMAPFYSGIKADDTSLDPYFELAEELGIPVGFHIFPGGPNYGFHLMPEMLGGMRAYNSNPMQLENVITKYPDIKIYIMHGAWPYLEDLKALMYAHPNVYIDIAVVNWILPQEEFNFYIESLINAGFGDRIMYGTDQMAWPETINRGIETVNNADFLTPEQKEDIFYNNAARFLGLTEEEISKHKSIVR